MGLTSLYSSMMRELTSRGFPLSADRMRYIVKLHPTSAQCNIPTTRRDSPSRKTSDGTKETLESLGHVMREIILVN